MGLAIFPRSWSEKPPIGIMGKAAHSLTPDHAWLFNDNALGGSTGVTSAVPMNIGKKAGATRPPSQIVDTGFVNRVHRRYGTCRDNVAVSAGPQVFWTLASEFFPTGPVSVVLAYHKDDAVNYAGQAFGPLQAEVVDGEYCQVALPHSDGTVYWTHGLVASGQLTAAGLTFGEDVWVFTSGGGSGGMQIWQNGLLRASQAGSSARTQSATARACLTDAAPATYGFLYIYHRQLLPCECQQITFDPYCWLQSSNMMRLLAGGGIGTLTGTAIGGISPSDLIAGGKTIIATMSGDSYISN